jgi:CheY-like chemotaxis protein
MGRHPADVLTGVHVLVVDDDGDTRDLVRTVLQYWGALVTVAASAPEAIELLRLVMPDVLLTDISMPDQDGYWLIRELRKLPPDQSGKIPAVAITAFGEEHGPDRTLGAGFQGHLRKPIDPWDLCTTLAGVAPTG